MNIIRAKKIIWMVMEPKLRNIMVKLSRELDDAYFKLTTSEKEFIALQIKNAVLNETSKLLGGYGKHNSDIIYQSSVENLQQLKLSFEQYEMYSQCQMMVDTISLIKNDIQRLDNEQL